MVSIVDVVRRSVMELSSSAQRIVSLVPSTTESICAFGGVARLVGRTRYCVEPSKGLEHVTMIGGTKNPRLEAVLALKPDLIVGNSEENRAEDLEYLAARVPMLVQTPRTVVEAVQGLHELATRLGVLDVAEPWLRRIEASMAEVEVAVRGLESLNVYYAIWRKPWMTVNADTFVNDVLALCGARSVAADHLARYPTMSPDEAVSHGVDLVLLSSEPWKFDGDQRDDILASRCFGDAEVRLCDGRDFSWHGAHMAKGLVRALAALQR